MFFYLYLILLLTSFILGVVLPKHDKSFFWLTITLAVYVLSESMLLVMYRINGKVHFLPYHITVPLSTVFVLLFFRAQFKEGFVRMLCLFLIFVFVASSIIISFISSFDRFPGLQINLMGVMIIGLSLYALFTLEPIQGVSILRHPLAWISLGFTVFYSGIFFFNGIYNKLRIVDKKKAGMLHAALNHGPNCFMYLCFCIAFYLSYRLYKEKAVES